MTKYAKLIDDKDNVATAVADCTAGDELAVGIRGYEEWEKGLKCKMGLIRKMEG